MEHIRKTFSNQDYQLDDKAFNFLSRDIANYNVQHQTTYYPVLRDEDYDIDVAVYYNEQDYIDQKTPIFYIELEVKTQKAGNWKPNAFPYDDAHCLYRKDHLLLQPAVPFWVCYNYDSSDCMTIPFETIANYPIAENSSSYGDLIHVIPKEAFIFGLDNLMPYIEAYAISQNNQNTVSLYESYLFMNKSFRIRHRFFKVRQAQSNMTNAMRKNQTMTSIKGFI